MSAASAGGGDGGGPPPMQFTVSASLIPPTLLSFEPFIISGSVTQVGGGGVPLLPGTLTGPSAVINTATDQQGNFVINVNPGYPPGSWKVSLVFANQAAWNNTITVTAPPVASGGTGGRLPPSAAPPMPGLFGLPPPPAPPVTVPALTPSAAKPIYVNGKASGLNPSVQYFLYLGSNYFANIGSPDINGNINWFAGPFNGIPGTSYTFTIRDGMANVVQTVSGTGTPYSVSSG